MFTLIFCLSSGGLAFGATMPDSILGNWCSDSEMSHIEVTPKGFQGSSDGEGWACDVKYIKEVANQTWRAVFSCNGEFGTVEIRSLIKLQMLNGSLYLAWTETLNKRDAKKIASSPPLTISSKC